MYSPEADNIVVAITLISNVLIFFSANEWYLLFDSTNNGWLFDWFHIPRVLKILKIYYCN